MTNLYTVAIPYNLYFFQACYKMRNYHTQFEGVIVMTTPICTILMYFMIP